MTLHSSARPVQIGRVQHVACTALQYNTLFHKPQTQQISSAQPFFQVWTM